MGNNPKIVGDHQVSELSLPLQFRQQVKDLSLHRHIQRRRRLIQQQHLRLKNQRSGYRHALPLPAGELMRITLAKGAVEANFIQQHIDPPVAVVDTMDPQRLFEDIANGVTGMQRSVGVLKYHLHLTAALAANFMP